MENSRQKSHCMDNKFVPAISDSLKALDRKIHYKLYMMSIPRKIAHRDRLN